MSWAEQLFQPRQTVDLPENPLDIDGSQIDIEICKLHSWG